MNNQIKVLVVGAIFLVIGLLIFSNWGNPESELEKTNVDIRPPNMREEYEDINQNECVQQ